MSEIIFNSYTDYLTVTLTFFSSFLALVMGLQYALVKDKNRGELFLCVLMFAVFIWRLSDGFKYLDEINPYFERSAGINAFTSIVYFFSGPFLYLYGNYYITYQEDAEIKVMPHMIIPTLSTIAIIAISVIVVVMGLNASYISYADRILVSATTVLVCFYVSLMLTRIGLLIKEGGISRRNFLIILGIIVLLIMGAALAYLWGSRLIISLLVLGALTVQLLFFDWIDISLQIVRDEAARRGAITQPVIDADIDDIIETIDIMMSWEKVYHDDRLSLKSCAERLGITPRHLSAILKANKGLGFVPLVNNYRINEARMILENENQTPVVEIASRVGFSSLSEFYTTFRRITGMSPGAYQKFIKK